MIKLIIPTTIDLQTNVNQIITIIYHQYSLPVVEEILNQEILFEEELSLRQGKNNNFYIAMRVTQQNTQPSQKQLERVIGLGNHIICIQLDNDKESFIENHHLSHHYSSLHFVNSTYSKEHSRIKESIFYHKYINQIPLTFEQLQTNMTIGDIVSIYHQCSFLEEETVFVRGVFERYKDLHSKQIEKQNQIRSYPSKYQQLKEEQEQNIIEIRKIKHQALFRIKNETISTWINEYSERWIKNTLKQLKQSFNAIANRRDTKALSEFRKLCQISLHKFQQLRQYHFQPVKQQKLSKMEKQIKIFIQYHEQVIKGQFFSSLHYYNNELKYLWKYQPKIYQKGAIFILIVFLAYLQENYISGITILSIGLIFTAINI